MRLKQRFWLLAMDLTNWLDWDRAWTYCLRKASDATDWGEGADCGPGVPF